MLTVEEQIAALEEQLTLVQGRGSAAKKKSIQSQIDALKGSVTEPEEKPAEEEPVQVVDNIPEGWVKVTDEEREAAEKAFLLKGYDPDKGIALIKKA